MRVSVVINTYNRAGSLAVTLAALRQQTYADFEVVVVNGPSSDTSAAVLDGWGDAIRVVTCPEVHLGKSRNLGIEAAAGDIVAFVDDDAVPEPSWIEELVAAYDSETVGGAGGIVFDHTGTKLQYRYSVSDRVGTTHFDVEPPFDRFVGPGADPFVYLQGTNASFRRECLVEAGGFDEEIEFQHDEVEVCLRLLDLGYELRPLAGAAVHHKYLPSHLRKEMMLWTDPYPAVKNRAYFALRNGRNRRTVDEIHAGLVEYVRHVKASADQLHQEGRLTRVQWKTFHQRAEHGFEVGLARGLAGDRKSRAIGPPNREAFRQFPTRRPQGPRLRICFVSGEYPPIGHGGIGRYTADLAGGLAEMGHDVHVVTISPDLYTTEYEYGVWVHRITVQDREIPGLQQSVLKGNYLHIAALYHHVLRLHERLPMDVVSAPIWNCEGLLCGLDDRLATVTTLMTTLDTIRQLHPSWNDSPHVRRLVELEKVTLRESRHLHPISDASLEQVRAHLSPGLDAPVMPVGERDRAGTVARGRRADGRTRVLFVGRLERRKGVDVLLEAVPSLLAEHPDVEFMLVGKDTEHTELTETYRERFLREHAQEPDVLSRVTFAGEASEAELWQHYADADIFCAPSRFESLGLVLVEAMMFGQPVVAGSVGGMVEIVDGNGLLAEPGDAASLVSCLSKLLGDRELRSRMGRRSRELFETQWSIEHAAARAAAGYGAIAEAHPRPGPALDEPLRERLANVLQEVEQWAPPQARQVAAALLDARCYPFDRVSALAALLDAPADEFIEGAYLTLFSREPDPEGFHIYLEALASGMSRLDVIRSLATSDEAANQHVDPWFLNELEAVSMARAVPASAQQLVPAVTSPAVLRAARGARRIRQSARAVARVARGRAAAQIELETAAQELRRANEARLDDLRQVTASLDAVGNALESGAEMTRADLRHTRERVRELESTLVAVREALAQQSAESAAQTERHRDQLGAVSRSLEDQARAREEVTKWLTVLGRKYEWLAKDARERVPVEAHELPEPRVVDPAGYEAKMAALDGDFRVNLGCGEKPLPDYVNVDAREVPDVDIVADVRRLPFDEGTLAEVASSHLVEHFREHELATGVLPYWRSLLQTDGIVRIVCPNWSALLGNVTDGDMSLEDFRQVTFGAQEYEGDDHFAMYTPESLALVLRDAGFRDVEVVATDRPNGLSLDMELTARR